MLSYKDYTRLQRIIAMASARSLGVLRKDMPQISWDKIDRFRAHMWEKNLPWDEVAVDPSELKPIQQDFNIDKIEEMILNNSCGTIFVTADNFVIDGHHRYLASVFLRQPIMVRRLKTNVRDSFDMIEDSKVA